MDDVEQECLRVMRDCEKLASGWGLPVAIRTFEELGIPSGTAAGLYISRPLPEWDENLPVCAIDIRAASALSNPADRVVSWTCHELAHHVVDATERAVLPECVEPNPDELRRALQVPTGPTQLVRCGLPAYCGHEHVFIFALCHIQFRTQAAGIWVSDQWSFPGSDYALSSLSRYRDALGHEPELMKDVDIIEVMKQKAPVAFVELWREDVTRAAQKKNVGSSRSFVSFLHSSEEPSSANV